MALSAMLARAGFQAWGSRYGREQLFCMVVLLCNRFGGDDPYLLYICCVKQMSSLIRRHRMSRGGYAAVRDDVPHVDGRPEVVAPGSHGPCGLKCCCQSKDVPPCDWIDDPSLPTTKHRLSWPEFYHAMTERKACWTAAMRDPEAPVPWLPKSDFCSDKPGQGMTPTTERIVPAKHYLDRFGNLVSFDANPRQLPKRKVNRPDIMRRCAGRVGPSPACSDGAAGKGCQAAGCQAEQHGQGCECDTRPGVQVAADAGVGGGGGGVDLTAGGAESFPSSSPLSVFENPVSPDSPAPDPVAPGSDLLPPGAPDWMR